LRGVALFKIHNDLARMGYSKSAVRAAPPFSGH
jgi:hypothetical protein